MRSWQLIKAIGEAASAQGRRSTCTRPWAPSTAADWLQGSGLASAQGVRRGGDVALTIEEQHSQQLAGGKRSAEAGAYEQMHSDDADRAGAGEGSSSHG